MVVVNFDGVIALIEDMVWKCEDMQLQTILNSTIPPMGPSGDDPDPNHTAAMVAINRLGGGVVTKRDDVEYVEGRIY